MSKIKIVSKEEEFEGKIVEGTVKPFGASAHIPFSKKHLGKFVEVIVPDDDEAEYTWILSEKERQEVVKVCTKIVSERKSNLKHYELEVIENIQNRKFKLDDMIKVVSFLKSSEKHKYLVEKLTEMYDLE